MYDGSIGYSPLENVDRSKLRAQIDMIAGLVKPFWRPDPASRVLVAGAGRGDEAILLHERFGLWTAGVDINLSRSAAFDAARGLSLQRQDLQNLGFKAHSFDLIYSYHVLEHVQDARRSLLELARVLKPGGVLFVGFPNRHRLFSYVGTSQRASAIEKLKWNANDYSFRLRGKFENRYGAHAGFTQAEFQALASGLFRSIVPVRNGYMLAKYPRLARMIQLMIITGASELLFPSNYFVCLKGLS
jgi:ubiquinone/menaquinone biosynthesis C-methylase UbiE